MLYFKVLSGEDVSSPGFFIPKRDALPNPGGAQSSREGRWIGGVNESGDTEIIFPLGYQTECNPEELNKFTVVPAAKSVAIGQKRKRGRPAKATKALLRQ